MSAFEAQVKAALESNGFTVLTRGWPDFLVVDGEGNLACVIELKAEGDTLRPDQKIVHALLRNAGLRVYLVHERRLEAFLNGLGYTGPKGEQWKRLSAAAERAPLTAGWKTSDPDRLMPYNGLGYRDGVMSSDDLGDYGPSPDDHPTWRQR